MGVDFPKGVGFWTGGETLRSGAGFLVLWLVKGEMLSFWCGSSQGRGFADGGRGCPVGGGTPGAVVGERGRCCSFWGGFFLKGVSLWTGRGAVRRGRVSWCCGWCRGKCCPLWGGFSQRRGFVDRARGCPVGGVFPGAVAGSGENAAFFGVDLPKGVGFWTGGEAVRSGVGFLVQRMVKGGK